MLLKPRVMTLMVFVPLPQKSVLSLFHGYGILLWCCFCEMCPGALAFCYLDLLEYGSYF